MVSTVPLPLLFSFTLFCSAVLLFLIQPMIGKMILPRLGGTPAVWNTCMVFFQALLLAGYAYAHYTTRWLGPRRQSLLHLALLAVPFVSLPLSVGAGWVPPREANPIPWILGLLFVTTGLPFFVVSTTAPLLQRWFAGTGHSSARDPYFLYGASNLGSMLALLAYPTVVEPYLRVAQQSWVWEAVYGLFVFLAAGCAVALWRSPRVATEPIKVGDTGIPSTFPIEKDDTGIQPVPHRDVPSHPPDHMSPLRVLHWIALAFVPSSVMLAATTFITTDIAAIPLLWVIPLALYLLTFILVFAGKPRISQPLTRLATVVLILVLLVLMLSDYTTHLGVATALALHLGLLFLVSLVCHGELARLRPSAQHLTGYYLAMSFGGVLGGLFNALLAPLIFTSLAEYPLTLVLACLLLPGRRRGGSRDLLLDLAAPVGVALVTVAAIWVADHFQPAVHQLSSATHVQVGYLNTILKFGVPALLCPAFLARPLRLGLAVLALYLVGGTFGQLRHQTLHAERGFFGVLQVKKGMLPEDENALPVLGATTVGFMGSPLGQGPLLAVSVLFPERYSLEYRYLLHGNTTHGLELADPARRREALAYYHETGPIGQLMSAFKDSAAKRRVAVTGLGVGALASYAEEGQEWTFYEIDPAVIWLAQDERYFHFLSDARERGVKVALEPGDARLRLEDAPNGAYNLIFMDAFSSDSVPVHLLTRQALDLYLSKMADDGLLVFNITNRYVDLEPVLAALARDAGLVGIAQHDRDRSIFPRKSPSAWVILARKESDLSELPHNTNWKRLATPITAAWTDDFSNLLGAFRIGN
jgi:spermidine synthase